MRATQELYDDATENPYTFVKKSRLAEHEESESDVSEIRIS